jgi:DNA-binding NarL/FixJ family response regulator
MEALIHNTALTGRGAGPAIRVLTVDDHPALRLGLAAMIRADPRLELVGEADNGDAGVKIFRELRPDITLMDLQMPVMNGVDAVKAICEEFPDAKIIILTTYSGDAQAITALQAGASGYLLKSSLRSDLVRAITEVHRGSRYLHPEIASEIAMHVGEEALRERELRTLELVARGMPNKQIAFEMSVSEETVKANLRAIFSKLDVKDRTQAVIVAIRRGMISV